MIKLLAICGSTKKSSSNLTILRILEQRYEGMLEFRFFSNLDKLPIFNPDLDDDTVPAAVSDFRNQVAASDAVLISTPEYAMGVPGGLKNALDWTVSSMEFSKKITGLITASTSGMKAHQSLIDTLLVIESLLPDERRVLISYIGAKLKNGSIEHAETLSSLDGLMRSIITDAKAH